MKLKPILSAASAVALLATASAATAQMAQGAMAGETENRAYPADPKHSMTGVPSVDSTRPTGADAGATMLPGGRITGTTDATVNTDDDMTAQSGTAVNSTAWSKDMQDRAAAPNAGEAGQMASTTGAVVSVSVTTNGPIPDTEANRARYGGPISRAGEATEPRGN